MDLTSNFNSNSIHCKLLNMLQWFHDTCAKNGLRYYIVGGTMLGAVRHQGFIPWDDDIDVAMPRQDYIKLIESLKDDKNYRIEFPDSDNLDFSYLYAKIYDTTTTLIEHRRCNVKRGIYIDIFPLDGIGDSYNNACTNFDKIYKCIKVHDMIVCAFRGNRKWYKNLSILLGRLISPLFISERKLNKYINDLCKKNDFDKSEYVGNLVGNWGYKEIMHRSYFGEPKEYEFENIIVWGVEKPHEYLTSLYGKYMVLPPEDKRKSHHDNMEINLNQSYLH